MTWMQTNFTNFFRLRKAWAIAFASCLAVSSASAELTHDELKMAIFEAIFDYATFSSGDGSAIMTIPLGTEWGADLEGIQDALYQRQGANYTPYLRVIYEYLRSQSFTNDLGEVVSGLDVLTNQLAKVSSNTDFVGSRDFQWYVESAHDGVWQVNNYLSYWTHGAANDGGADVYVQNFDELVWELERGLSSGTIDALAQSDVLNGATSFQETDPSYTYSQDTIDARYKYGGDSVSNSVGYLGAVEGLDGLLDPLQGVAQSVSIDELPELPIPSGSSVITFWSGLEIADTELPDAVVDVAEVLDADLRADIRKVLSVVYSLACGFLLFKRGLREYKYYASLGQTEGEE